MKNIENISYSEFQQCQRQKQEAEAFTLKRNNMYQVYNSRDMLLGTFKTEKEAEDFIEQLQSGDEKIPDFFDIRKLEETADGRYILSAEEIKALSNHFCAVNENVCDCFHKGYEAGKLEGFGKHLSKTEPLPIHIER